MPNAAGRDVTCDPAVAKSASSLMAREARNEEWVRRNNLGDYIVRSQVYEGQGKCDYCLFLLFFKS